MTRYVCPKCETVYISDGWCPDCGCRLVKILVEHPWPLETEPLHQDPNKD